FQNPDVKFVNINVASFDAYKHGSQLPVIADAREAITELIDALQGFRITEDFARSIAEAKASWDADVDKAFAPSKLALPGQPVIIGAVHASTVPVDVIIQASASLPADLQKLSRVRAPLGYHVKYAFSCMGYEIAGGIGAKRDLN